VKYLLIVAFLITLGWSETIKTFYADGKLKSATSYKKGKKVGIEHIYYKDGATLKYAKNYKDGKLHGLQQVYRKNALLVREENYRYGKLDGKSRYYTDGLLSKEVIYSMGMIDKEYKEFYPTGLTKLKIIWKSGEPVEGYFYNEIGQAKALSKQKLQSLHLRAFIESLPHVQK